MPSTWYKPGGSTSQRAITLGHRGANRQPGGILARFGGLPGMPVSGIRVRFADLPVTRIHLEPEGTELRPIAAGQEQAVDLPPLPLHTMVVFELEKTGRN